MDYQLKQANMMVARSKKELGTPEVDQTVAISGIIVELAIQTN
jgi:hypothetical protein